MGTLEFLYKTAAGRALLKPLVGRGVSRFSGALLDTGASRMLIGPFIRRAGIDTADYDLTRIHSFNDFFCRPLKPGRRSVDMDPDALIAPCDGLLTAVSIRNDTVLHVKQSRWSLSRMLGDAALASEFEGGVCLVVRLCVDNYHRYIYFDSGEKAKNVFLPGALHTVRPVALEEIPVFAENCREYTVIDTDSFGRSVQAEIGAMLVGFLLSSSGYDGALTVQSEAATSMIKFLYIGLPAILTLISAIVMNAYKLDEMMPQIEADLAARKEQQ